MSSEIWKIGQETTAQEMYDDVKQNGLNHVFFLRSETMAVVQLTKACADMITAYEEVIDDQNEYIVEIDDMTESLSNLTEDIQKRIETLNKEIEELQKKEEDGTITEEEKGKLSAKQEELSNLVNLGSETVSEETKKIKDENDERKSNARTKEKIATEYGELTVEKGTPLAETRVKGGFFRKLFGTTGKNKHDIGVKAVKTGNELLDKVGESSEVQEDIDKKIETNVTK